MSKNTIIKLEKQLAQAMLSSDISQLDKLISEKLLFTTPTGEIASKQMDLKAHHTGFQKLTKLKLLDQKLEFYETFAIVLARVAIEGNYGDIPISGNFCYTRVWANLAGHWQIVAGHASRIPDDTDPC